VIGLTGGIASGKTAVARMLRARGAVVVDADELARQVVAPGQPALAELVERFGPAVLAADGSLDRKRLGAIIFADPEARAAINAITHPRIATRSREEIQAAAERGARIVFYEAALLVENQTYHGLDGLVVVASSPAVQERRLVERDGSSAEDARARIASQLPVEDKKQVATWVIDNEGDLAELEHNVEVVVRQIEGRFGIAIADRGDPLPATAPLPTPAGTPSLGECILVTGYPAFTARRMIAKIVRSQPAVKIKLLARSKFAEDAQRFADELDRSRVEVLVGDVCDMDLGLSTQEYAALCKELTAVYHLAGVYYTGIDPRTARRINVVGTRGALELASDCRRLRRFLHWSTAQVSGKRRGLVREDELDPSRGWHNVYERTKFEAEKLARSAMQRLPVTVVRPGVIVGDSVTGEIDRLDGPYYLMVLIATNASGLRLPLPGHGEGPMHLVPIDYVIDAAHRLTVDERAAGRTFHLTDPAPLPARKVFELVAEHARTEKPRASLAGGLTRVLLNAPGLDRLARGPLAFLDSFDLPVYYDRSNADPLLEPAGIKCPPLESYLANLVRYVLDVRSRPGSGADDVEADEDVIDALD
jgi:dephospho-CoA kinase